MCFPDRTVTLRRVGGMGTGYLVGVTGLLCGMHTSFGLQPAHLSADLGIDEPVHRGHRGSVVEEGRVAYDERFTRTTSHDDLEATLGWATEQRPDHLTLGSVRHLIIGHAPMMTGRCCGPDP